MKAREVIFAKFVKSRYMATILGSVALICMLIASDYGKPFFLTANRGIALPSPNLWLASLPEISMAVNVLAIVITAGTMLYLNAAFGILRSFSTTFAGLFMLMTAAQPSLAALFQGSALLALVMMIAAVLICSAYNDPRATRRLFLAFFLTSAGAMAQYGFIVYVAVLFVGCAQMRALTPRSLLGAILGIVAPWWIWWGFAPTLSPAIEWPEFVNMFAKMGSVDVVRTLVVTGTTLFFGLIFGTVNIIRIFSLNAKSRAFNGFLMMMAIVTWVMLFVDFTNLPFYIMLLNALTAFQIGHFFAINYQRRGYLVILILSLVYLGFYIWEMI